MSHTIITSYNKRRAVFYWLHSYRSSFVGKEIGLGYIINLLTVMKVRIIAFLTAHLPLHDNSNC